MVAAVYQGHLDVDERIPCQGAVVHRLLNAHLDGWDVFPGDGPPHDAVLEKEALAPFPGLDLEPYVSILAPATRLSYEPALDSHGCRDSLSVRYPGLADVGLNAELSTYAFH